MSADLRASVSPTPSPPAGRCAWASTRTRRCWSSGGCPTAPTGLARFTDAVVDALAGSVAVLKPQLAFYERHGSRGLAVLEDGRRAGPGRRRAGAAGRQAGRHRLDDGRLRRLPAPRPPAGRRRDDGQPLPRPRLAAAGRRHRPAHGGGLFVLARTSNPDAGTLQHALVGERRSPSRSWTPCAAGTPGWVVGDPLPTSGPCATCRAAAGRAGSFGVVVGATLRELDVDLDGLGGPVLAPGLGAQGGSAGRPAPAVRRRAPPSCRPSRGTCWPPVRTSRRCARPPTGGTAELAGRGRAPACRGTACRASTPGRRPDRVTKQHRPHPA